MSVKIGARYFKTALAVVICIFFGSLFNKSSSFFSAIAAIISMQGTFSDSLIQGKNRIFGTFIGAVLGFVFALILPGNPLLIGLGIIIVIYICTSLKWDGSIIIASIVFLAIMLDADKHILEYSAFRLLDTSSGVIIALLVNYFILPHKPLVKVYKKCNKLIKDFPEIIDQVLHSHEKVNLENLHQDVIKLKQKANIKEFDLIAHKEDEEDVKRIANVIEGLLTIYEHLSFVEELKRTNSVFHSSKTMQDPIEERKMQDIILEFHRQQVSDGWNRVKKLWDERGVKV